MHVGYPTPFTPGWNAPPPVPAPDPGPRPPPSPLPMPPQQPVPMPFPPPGPPQLFTIFASGSPSLHSDGFGIFSSGASISVGSAASFGLGFFIVGDGGVNCVMRNFGARP